MSSHTPGRRSRIEPRPSDTDARLAAERIPQQLDRVVITVDVLMVDRATTQPRQQHEFALELDLDDLERHRAGVAGVDAQARGVPLGGIFGIGEKVRHYGKRHECESLRPLEQCGRRRTLPRAAVDVVTPSAVEMMVEPVFGDISVKLTGGEVQVDRERL